MNEALLRVEKVTKRFGGFTALDNVDLGVVKGERLGLIGPNGSGKSTLVNCISGTLRNEAGDIRFEGRDVGRDPAAPAHPAGHGPQLPDSQALRKHVGARQSARTARARRAPTLPAQGANAAEAMDILNEHGLRGQGARAFPGADPGGHAEARARARDGGAAALLISDEAMAGLGVERGRRYPRAAFGLNESGVAVMMIEHVMRAVMRFSERVAVPRWREDRCEGEPEDIVAESEA